MKRTIVVAVVAGLIAIFNGWIAEHISPAFRLPETVAEDIADKVDTIDLVKDESASVSVTETARVTRVIDGDTAEMHLDNGETVLVRYIGIDTPERATDTKVEECFYKEATDKNRELVEGKEVVLKRDVSDTDKYGRLLRYVYVGEDFVNSTLVSSGVAEVIRIEPDTANFDTLKAAEEEAKAASVGMWSICKS